MDWTLTGGREERKTGPVGCQARTEEELERQGEADLTLDELTGES